jgi:hypothetical protein
VLFFCDIIARLCGLDVLELGECDLFDAQKFADTIGENKRGPASISLDWCQQFTKWDEGRDFSTFIVPLLKTRDCKSCI